MDRIELGKALNLNEELIARGRDNRPGTRINPTSVTLHNTDNDDRGANADRHSRFVRETGFYLLNGAKRQVSWHFTVDDAQVVKQLPLNELAYHAKTANRSSLGVEICMNSDIDQPAANERAAKLVAALLYDLGLGTGEIRTHRDWTGKDCPSLLLKSLDAFKARVGAILSSLSGPRGGLEFDASDLGLTPEHDAASLKANWHVAFPDVDGDMEEGGEIDHDALREGLAARALTPDLLPSGNDRIEKALELVKANATYPLGCSGFICEVLGIPHEVANALMGATPTSLGDKPPYAKLAPGDIVGWKDAAASGHVALYYGKSDAEFFIDVRAPGAKPRIKNGYYDRTIFKSARF